MVAEGVYYLYHVIVTTLLYLFIHYHSTNLSQNTIFTRNGSYSQCTFIPINLWLQIHVYIIRGSRRMISVICPLSLRTAFEHQPSYRHHVTCVQVTCPWLWTSGTYRHVYMFQVQGQYTDLEIMRNGQTLQQVLKMRPCLLSVTPTMIPPSQMTMRNAVIFIQVYVVKT